MIIFIAHNMEEAVFLADRALVVTRRSARIMAEIDVTALLSLGRDPAMSDGRDFFDLRNELPTLARATSDEKDG